VLEQPRPLRPRLRATGSTGNSLLGALGRLDQRLLVMLRTRGHNPASERLAGALGRFGEWGLGWVAIGVLGAGLDRDRAAAWLTAGGLAPLAVIVNYGVKVVIGRERPVIEDHPRLARAPSKLSFPSAHATSSGAAAAAMARLSPSAAPALNGLALAICLGRPFLGMHYPSDAVAGFLLGREIGRACPLPGTGPHEIWAR
jgi:membrane-associated phospholipid phosphatase